MPGTFSKGGLFLNEEKISAEKAIEILPLPDILYVSLSQHLGSPAKEIVRLNDEVKTGQLIGKAEGLISANVHSPATGIVTGIEDIPDVDKIKRKTIIIRTRADEWAENINQTVDHDTRINWGREEILGKIRDAGIVGMGGATFPTFFKLNVPQGKEIDTLIINGNECEPYLTSDYRLMIEKAGEIITGIRLLMIALNVEKALIGIGDNKPVAINIFRGLLGNDKNIFVKKLKTKYPQGSEKHLIKALINKEVPSGKLPLDSGVVVHNIGTVFAVYEAVQKNKPLIERIITVTGRNLSKPSNFKVRIGTPVSFLVEHAGGIPGNTRKIIFGGPMMGKNVSSMDIPVSKGTTGIVLLSENEARAIKQYNCIRCRSCVRACPMGLPPYLLSNLNIAAKFEMSEKEGVLDCIECGCCSYICPSGIRLLDNIRGSKVKVNIIIKQRNADNRIAEKIKTGKWAG